MFKKTRKKIEDMIEERFEKFAERCGKKSVFELAWDFQFDIKSLPSEVKLLRDEKVSHSSLVSCSKCKCLLYKTDAIKELSIVGIKKYYLPDHEKEVVVEHYSCCKCK